MTSIRQHETVRDLQKTISVPVTREDLAISAVIKAAESAEPPRAVPYNRDTILDSLVSAVDDRTDVDEVEEAAKAFVDEHGEEFDPQTYKGNAALRKGPSGTTTTSGQSDGSSGAQGGEPRTSGTMADYKSNGGTGESGGLLRNVAGSGETTSAGTMADYKEKQAKADARPVRLVDESELSANSSTAYKQRKNTETVRVVGVASPSGDGKLKTNATGTGAGSFDSLRSTDGERVRITDDPGADPIVLSEVNTAGGGGTMMDYKEQADATDVVVVNPDALPEGSV